MKKFIEEVENWPEESKDKPIIKGFLTKAY